MNVFNIIYTILISPLRMFFETLYMMANKIIGNPGMSIIVLSLAMNFLVLPLYKRADAMQEEERDIEMKLHKGVSHIKKTFKGDEKMMILQAYYRQNNYKPTYVFKGAMSLFLEIPFFIAAYQFLSNLEVIRGVSFGVLRDLGSPDALINIGGFHINLLPIIMTAVNLISCIIFTKGYPLKTKIQLYSMAIFFLFFLYTSPSGLVFYWTLNNVFSLVKTVFYKLKHAGKILAIMAAVSGAVLFVSSFWISGSVKKPFVAALGIALIIPLAVVLVKQLTKIRFGSILLKSDAKVFFAGAVFMALLVGLLIPSSVIKASPQEFVDINYFYHPLWFICSSFCLAVGTFVVWMGVFYKLASKKSRVYFDIAIWILCGVSTVNYMFFGKGLGNLSNTLKYDNGISFTGNQILVNLAVIIAVAVVMVVILRFGKKLAPQILIIAGIAFLGMSVLNMNTVKNSVAELSDSVAEAETATPSFTLSKNGKNVVFIMLDRAMNEYVPYILNEKPELKKTFSGFTYYANTYSYGGCTNFGSPALYGGYEYTPYEMNKRDTESLASKQNEALKVMPTIFYSNNYEVSVCSPTYANYQWVPDLTIYNDYPNMNTFIASGHFSDKKSRVNVINNNKRNFFYFGLMKAIPVALQGSFYDDGSYFHEQVVDSMGWQTRNGCFTSDGISTAFMNEYTVLENLSQMTGITEDSKNTFFMMSNDTTHEPMLLQEPEYVPAQHVDNTEYEEANSGRYTVNGVTLKMTEESHYIHYQCNMAAWLQIGEWLDYLKENGVYDNTRIIISADHGWPFYQLDSMDFGDHSDSTKNAETYYPLLLMKDFDSKEFTTSEDFMSNADVPTLAVSGLISDPVNPFTGKPINSDVKTNETPYIFGSTLWDTQVNNGNVFLPGNWYTVHDDVRNKDNWDIITENSTSPVS